MDAETCEEVGVAEYQAMEETENNRKDLSKLAKMIKRATLFMSAEGLGPMVVGATKHVMRCAPSKSKPMSATQMHGHGYGCLFWFSHGACLLACCGSFGKGFNSMMSDFRRLKATSTTAGGK